MNHNTTAVSSRLAGSTEGLSIEALHKAYSENEELLASIPSILISVDKDHRITRWNHAAENILGVKAEDVLGRQLNELTIQWDQVKLLEQIANSLNNSHPTPLEGIRFTRPDGKEGFLGFTLNPVTWEGEKRNGFLLFGADISGRRILESQLRQAQKMESIGQLAAGIAHEINTPTQYVGDNTHFVQDAFGDLINVLKKYEQLLEACRSKTVTPHLVAEVETMASEADVEYLMEEIPKAIEQSLEGIQRIGKIVQSMKDFAHPGSTEKKSADLNKAIESTITVARNEWKYVAEMKTDFDSTMPSVPCLLGDFNQVVLNMIVNASHAIKDVVGDGENGKGTIAISTRCEGEWAVIRISDTGTGIPEAARPKIFDPFFTTKEVGKGTGQGLAIAYSVVVEKHGGEISFETEVGQGTTFTIRLPLNETPCALELEKEAVL